MLEKKVHYIFNFYSISSSLKKKNQNKICIIGMILLKNIFHFLNMDISSTFISYVLSSNSFSVSKDK